MTKRKVRHQILFYLFKFCCKLGLGLEQSTASPEKLSKSWPRPKLVNCRGKPVSCWPVWLVPMRLLKSDWLAEALLSSDWLAEALLSSDWLAHLLDTWEDPCEGDLGSWCCLVLGRRGGKGGGSSKRKKMCSVVNIIKTFRFHIYWVKGRIQCWGFLCIFTYRCGW